MFDLPSILPPNHTAVEAALEQAIRKGKPDLTPIAKLMNPDTCPADLLGWLAWTFSVDVWDANWSEMIKREVIRRSIAIHRIKGTVGSVRRALATISFRSDISEWFEHSGDPHTFRIDAFADDIFDAGFQIDAKLHALVTELIQNVKPVRAHFALRVGESFSDDIYLRTGAAPAHLDQTSHDPAPRLTIAECGVYLRTEARLTEIADVPQDPTPRTNKFENITALRADVRPMLISRITHEIEGRIAA